MAQSPAAKSPQTQNASRLLASPWRPLRRLRPSCGKRALRHANIGCISAVILILSSLTCIAQEDASVEPFAFQVSEINSGLPPVNPPLRLDAPRAALESFFDAVTANDPARAVQALNLGGIPEQDRAEVPRDLPCARIPSAALRSD